MHDDPLQLIAREVLRERLPVLVRESCAWSVGLSDAPHFVLRHGRTVATGVTLGLRAEAGQSLSVEEAGRLELAEATPGSFQDALNALTADSGVHADRYDAQVLEPFVLDTCVLAAERAQQADPAAWVELLDELGEDGSDLPAAIRAAEWEAPLRMEAELLILAALGHVPLADVEAEGLALSVVRAAETAAREAVPDAVPAAAPGPDELAGALFLAERALEDADLPRPVPPQDAARLLSALGAYGIEPEEALALLPRLPVRQETAEQIARRIAESS